MPPRELPKSAVFTLSGPRTSPSRSLRRKLHLARPPVLSGEAVALVGRKHTAISSSALAASELVAPASLPAPRALPGGSTAPSHASRASRSTASTAAASLRGSGVGPTRRAPCAGWTSAESRAKRQASRTIELRWCRPNLQRD